MPIEKLRGQFLKDNKSKSKKSAPKTMFYGSSVSDFGRYKQNGHVLSRKGTS